MAKNPYFPYDKNDTARLIRMIPGMDGNDSGAASLKFHKIMRDSRLYKRRYDCYERLAAVVGCSLEDAKNIYLNMRIARELRYNKRQRSKMFSSVQPYWKRRFLRELTEKFTKSYEEFPEF